jgi:hypothetical protein
MVETNGDFYVLILRQPIEIMDMLMVRKWVIFFIGILCAIIIADTLSNMIVAAVGLSGWVKFLVSFVLYAVLFFGILYAIEKIFGISFFGFWQE